MCTFKTVGGKHRVTIYGREYVCDTLHEAWAIIAVARPRVYSRPFV